MDEAPAQPKNSPSESFSCGLNYRGGICLIDDQPCAQKTPAQIEACMKEKFAKRDRELGVNPATEPTRNIRPLEVAKSNTLTPEMALHMQEVNASREKLGLKPLPLSFFLSQQNSQT